MWNGFQCFRPESHFGLTFICLFLIFLAIITVKPSLKIRTANTIYWNSLGLFRDYGLNYIFFRNKTFLLFKIESWNFQHLFENGILWNLTKFQLIQLIQTFFPHFLYPLPDWVEILWDFTKFFFKLMLSKSFSFLSWKTKKFYS